MTANWFECKVKYVKISEEGKEKKVSEQYLVDALTFTETEARITAELTAMSQEEFSVIGLKRSSISEWVKSNNEKDDKLFKARIAIVDADHLTGKEKRTFQHFLVAGATLECALENLKENLAAYIVPYEILSLSDTTFVDVLPYEVKEETTSGGADTTADEVTNVAGEVIVETGNFL
ncbi:MAG: DUF4494 domain-containing protein [Odoribacteraceae bacterium]|jgi:hypothetical protein|nr:DUF4494 domain-containing protein [Odoribacteraceae bacterium]